MKQLTENQQRLIAKITEEFMAMNDYPKPTSFADILLDEINQTKQDFEAIEVKNQAIFAELSKQFEEDMAYLAKECNKLGIEVEYTCFERNSGTDYCGSSICFGKNQGHDERFYIYARVRSWFHGKNGLRKYELTPNLIYYIESDKQIPFMDLMNNDVFKNRITRLYHKLNVSSKTH